MLSDRLSVLEQSHVAAGGGPSLPITSSLRLQIWTANKWPGMLPKLLRIHGLCFELSFHVRDPCNLSISAWHGVLQFVLLLASSHLLFVSAVAPSASAYDSPGSQQVPSPV